MKAETPLLSVVIASWNTKEFVTQCLESLEPSRSRLPVEIILVDNASSDGTPKHVRQRFPHVRVVQNQVNSGFAHANNIGIEISSAQYICFVNSDVVVSDGCLEGMLNYMDRHPDIGMLGPKMMLPNGAVGQSCMKFPTVWNWLCNALGLASLFEGSGMFGDFMMRSFKYDRIEDVDILTGWFWMVRREAVDQVGLLDDRFFMYGEDIDWPKRFHQSGWRVVFYPEAEAVHHCGASTAHMPIRFYVEMNRANLQYFRKYHSSAAVVGFWLATWLHQILRIIGYGLLFLVKPSDRAMTAYKIRRSVWCFLWLMGVVRV